MDTDHVTIDKKQTLSNDTNNDLTNVIAEYEELSSMQHQERQELLTRIDELTKRSSTSTISDKKLDQFTSLLLDIRSQIASITTKTGKIPKLSVNKEEILTKPEVVATDTEIQSLSDEVHNRSARLDEEIASLTHLLQKKKQEIDSKDVNIEELNDRLDMLGEEKQRLANELEKMNSIISSWKNQLSLLQKLANSDPRYRVVETLKKHGNLSDIQLAFTMGTSIHQLRKYIDDLIELKLIRKTSNGKYIWTGQESS